MTRTQLPRPRARIRLWRRLHALLDTRVNNVEGRELSLAGPLRRTFPLHIRRGPLDPGHPASSLRSTFPKALELSAAEEKVLNKRRHPAHASIFKLKNKLLFFCSCKVDGIDNSSSIDRLCKLVHDLKEEDLNHHKQKIEIAKRRMAMEEQQSASVPLIVSEG